MDEIQDLQARVSTLEAEQATTRQEMAAMREQLETLLSCLDTATNTGGAEPTDSTPNIEEPEQTQAETQQPTAPPMRPEAIMLLARRLHFVAAIGDDVERVVNAVVHRADLLRKRFADSPDLAKKYGITSEQIETAISSAIKIHDARIAAELAEREKGKEKKKETKDKGREAIG